MNKTSGLAWRCWWLALDFIRSSALMIFSVKVHAMLTLHADHAMGWALVIELTVLLVWKVNLVDGVRVFLQIFPTWRSLPVNHTRQKHQQCWLMVDWWRKKKMRKCKSINLVTKQSQNYRISLLATFKRNLNSTHQLHKLFAHSISL